MRRSTWGSKRKRPDRDNCYELRYRIHGQRRSEYFYGTSKEADARLSELRLRYEESEDLTGITVSEYYDNRFLDYIRRDLAPTTVVGYMNDFERYVRPVFGDYALDDISPKKLQQWLSTMTVSSAKHARAVLSSLLSYAVTDEAIKTNPLRNKYRMPKARSGKTVDDGIYSREELELIASLCVGEIWEAPFYFAAFGGASRYEAMGVRPEDIRDVDGYAVIHLCNGVHRVDGKVLIRDELKNEFRPREIVIEPKYAKRVFELKEEAEALGESWMCDDGFGMPVDPNSMFMAYKRWFATQPIVYHPFKNLRNSYTTMMLADGIDGSMIAKMIGNSQRGTTEKHYERPSANDFIAAIELTRTLGVNLTPIDPQEEDS